MWVINDEGLAGWKRSLDELVKAGCFTMIIARCSGVITAQVTGVDVLQHEFVTGRGWGPTIWGEMRTGIQITGWRTSGGL